MSGRFGSNAAAGLAAVALALLAGCAGTPRPTATPAPVEERSATAEPGPPPVHAAPAADVIEVVPSASAPAADAVTTGAGAAGTAPAPVVEASVRRPVKVVIVTMFEPEAAPWLGPFGLTESVPVPGLLPAHPALRCNTDGVCLLVAGMGHANAAASTLAVAMDPALDLRRAYWLVAGIAGIDPAQGTLGSAAWARWLIDYGIAHEIDAREKPPAWSTGYFGVMTQRPGQKPAFEYHTEAFRLDEALLQTALRLTRDVALEDSAAARAYRARYRRAPANQPPKVIQCDTLAGDTWWHGHRLGTHARAWTRLLSDGQATYCTTQQEDNATYNALARAAAAGRVDLRRLAVLRTGSNFDRPHPGQSAQASLRASTSGATGGFAPATRNLEKVGGVLVRDIVARWPLWRESVPPAP